MPGITKEQILNDPLFRSLNTGKMERPPINTGNKILDTLLELITPESPFEAMPGGFGGGIVKRGIKKAITPNLEKTRSAIDVLVQKVRLGKKQRAKNMDKALDDAQLNEGTMLLEEAERTRHPAALGKGFISGVTERAARGPEGLSENPTKAIYKFLRSNLGVKDLTRDDIVAALEEGRPTLEALLADPEALANDRKGILAILRMLESMKGK